MSFDLIAPVYDRLARLVFGNTLDSAQAWCVDGVPAGSCVLVLGGGTGRFLPDLLARKPALIVYVEASAAMLSRAQARFPELPENLRFQRGTEVSLVADGSFDLILLPFILDLYPDSRLTAQFLPRLLRLLTNEGALLVCDFDRPTAWWQQGQLWLMIRFFRLVAHIEIKKLPNWPAALRQAGFVETERAGLRNGQVRMGAWHRATPVPAPGTPPSAH